MRFRKTLTFLMLATALVFALSALAQQKPGEQPITQTCSDARSLRGIGAGVAQERTDESVREGNHGFRQTTSDHLRDQLALLHAGYF
jgi:hypothetical protein